MDITYGAIIAIVAIIVAMIAQVRALFAISLAILDSLKASSECLLAVLASRRSRAVSKEIDESTRSGQWYSFTFKGKISELIKHVSVLSVLVSPILAVTIRGFLGAFFAPRIVLYLSSICFAFSGED